MGREAVVAKHSTDEGGALRPTGPTGGQATPGITEKLERPTGDTLRSPTVTPTLQRIAAQAARDPDRAFTTLAPLIDEDFLREAYRQTRKSSAAGIDGVTAQGVRRTPRRAPAGPA